MGSKEQKFEIYRTVLRFLSYKVTDNLKKIYLDINLNEERVLLTAVYKQKPTDLELELFDDIVTNSDAHLPNLYVDEAYKYTEDYNKPEKHDFVVFSVYQ